MRTASEVLKKLTVIESSVAVADPNDLDFKFEIQTVITTLAWVLGDTEKEAARRAARILALTWPDEDE